MDETCAQAANELIIRVVTRGRGNFSVGYKQFSWKLVDMDESGDYDENDTSIDDSFRLSKTQYSTVTCRSVLSLEIHPSAASAVWSQVYVVAVRCCIARHKKGSLSLHPFFYAIVSYE